MPVGALGRIGRPGTSECLALDHGGDAMWLWPLSFSVNVRKTRTGWQATVRVGFLIG